MDAEGEEVDTEIEVEVENGEGSREISREISNVSAAKRSPVAVWRIEEKILFGLASKRRVCLNTSSMGLTD